MKKYIFIAAIVVVGILAITAADNLFETNQDGHYQVKQAFYTGNMSVRSQSGTYSQWFGTIWDYKNVATVRFGTGDDGGGEASATLDAIPVIFSDGSKGLISGLVRIKLPTQPSDRLYLKNEFADGYDHFIESGLKPVVNNAIKLAANLRTAQDAYTTLAQFQFAISDQLENGMYKTKMVTKYITRETGDIEEIRSTEVLIDTLTGLPYREANRILELGAVVTECVIEVPQFDSKVEEMISRRKDEAMKTELAKQAAIRAKQDAITSEQQGLANVAEEKYKKEVTKIAAVTEASKRYEVEKYAALQAKETAKKIKAEGDAKAFANRALVAAGLTPQQKMEMQIKIAEVVSANVAKASTPKVVFMGGGEGAANEVMNIFGAERSLELIKKLGEMK